MKHRLREEPEIYSVGLLRLKGALTWLTCARIRPQMAWCISVGQLVVDLHDTSQRWRIVGSLIKVLKNVGSEFMCKMIYCQ